jgi:hypothetical protein
MWGRWDGCKLTIRDGSAGVKLDAERLVRNVGVKA